jgi:outer membrane murein-binding lipoprotein Lpp
MLRRYVLPCALILLVSFGAGGVAYLGQAKTVYSTNCVFQAFIHVSREDPSTPEHAQFIAGIALQEVDTALASGLYTRVSGHEKTPSDLIASETKTGPAPGLATFAVFVMDPIATRATRLADAVCDEYVSSIRKQRADQVAAQVKTVADRLNSLQNEVNQLAAIPAAKLTPIQKVTLLTRKGQVIYNSQLMANLTSYPPDEVALLSRAGNIQKQQTGELSKKLLIAGVAGVLVCFLYILIGEMLAMRGSGARMYESPEHTTERESARKS